MLHTTLNNDDRGNPKPLLVSNGGTRLEENNKPQKSIPLPFLMMKQQELLRSCNAMKGMQTCSLYGRRVNQCVCHDSVDVVIHKSGAYSLRGVVTRCKNIYCATCGRLRAAEYIDEIKDAFLASSHKRMKVQFFTFTKGKNVNIAASIDEAYSGLSSVIKSVNNYNKDNGKANACMGLIEPSFSRDRKLHKGRYSKLVHNHAHGCLFLDENMSDDDVANLRSKMEAAWKRGVVKAGGFVFTNASLNHVVADWKLITDSNTAVQGVSKYLFALSKGETMSVAHELTSHEKGAKGRGMHTLLADIVRENCPEDIAMYQNFITAHTGRRRFRKTKGYRELVKKGEELRTAVEREVTRREAEAFLSRYDVGTWEEFESKKSKLILNATTFEKMDMLSSMIQGKQDWTNQKALEGEIEREKRASGIIGKVSFSSCLWNSLAWNSDATYLVIEFIRRHYYKSQYGLLFGLFKEWVDRHRNYRNEDRRIDKTMVELDEWIQRITMVMGTAISERLVRKRITWVAA